MGIEALLSSPNQLAASVHARARGAVLRLTAMIIPAYFHAVRGPTALPVCRVAPFSSYVKRTKERDKKIEKKVKGKKK